MKQSPRRLDLRCPVSAYINHEEIAGELLVVGGRERGGVGVVGGVGERLQMQELCGG